MFKNKHQGFQQVLSHEEDREIRLAGFAHFVWGIMFTVNLLLTLRILLVAFAAENKGIIGWYFQASDYFTRPVQFLVGKTNIERTFFDLSALYSMFVFAILALLAIYVHKRILDSTFSYSSISINKLAKSIFPDDVHTSLRGAKVSLVRILRTFL